MPVVVYSLLRLLLFGAAALLLWLAGMGGWLLVIVSAVAAGALSYVLLGAQRTAAARWIAERRAGQRPRFGSGVAADEDAEDAAVEAAQMDTPEATERPTGTTAETAEGSTAG